MRAVIYTRVSSDPKQTARSVEEQEQECRALCERNGWTVVEVFVDNDRSASRYAKKDRPAYRRVVDAINASLADVLVLWEGSRAQRDLRDYIRLRDLCAERKVLYCYSGKTYDLSRTDDRFSTGLDALLAEREADQTRDRTLRSARANAANGRPHGKLQYGFIREYDERGNFVRQVEHPEQAAVIREAAQRVSAGEPCRSVAIDFNQRGIPVAQQPCPDDCKRDHRHFRDMVWDLTQIRRIVSNPAYVAQRVHQGVVVGDAAWPAILDPAVYAVCTTRMRDPERRTQRNSTLKHLLSGVARCGVCHGHMRVQKNRTNYAYLCEDAFHVSVKTSSLEEFITAVVLERMARPDIAELFAQPDNGPASAAAKELADTKVRMEGFYEQAVDGKISPVGLAKLEAKLLPRIVELEQLAQPLSIPPTLRALATPDPAKVWAGLDVGQQREVIGLLMEVRVNPTRRGARTFDPQRVAITWKADA